MDLDEQHKLIKAVKRADIAMIRHLVSSGVDLNAQNRQGLTPLCIAAIRGNTRVVAELIDLGADVNLPSRIGFAPLTHAVSAGQQRAIFLLRRRGARHETTNPVVEHLRKRFPDIDAWFPLWQRS